MGVILATYRSWHDSAEAGLNSGCFLGFPEVFFSFSEPKGLEQNTYIRGVVLIQQVGKTKTWGPSKIFSKSYIVRYSYPMLPSELDGFDPF